MAIPLPDIKSFSKL